MLRIAFRQYEKVSIIEHAVEQAWFLDGDGLYALRTDSHYIPFEYASLIIHHDGTRYHDDEIHMIIKDLAHDREEEHAIDDDDGGDDIPEIRTS